jgi:hypothetical protein
MVSEVTFIKVGRMWWRRAAHHGTQETQELKECLLSLCFSF